MAGYALGLINSQNINVNVNVNVIDPNKIRHIKIPCRYHIYTFVIFNCKSS